MIQSTKCSTAHPSTGSSRTRQGQNEREGTMGVVAVQLLPTPINIVRHPDRRDRPAAELGLPVGDQGVLEPLVQGGREVHPGLGPDQGVLIRDVPVVPVSRGVINMGDMPLDVNYDITEMMEPPSFRLNHIPACMPLKYIKKSSTPGMVFPKPCALTT